MNFDSYIYYFAAIKNLQMAFNDLVNCDQLGQSVFLFFRYLFLRIMLYICLFIFF